MTDNVVSLRGEAVGGLSHEAGTRPASKANEVVIAELERLLALAKSGELQGLAGAYSHDGQIVSYSYAGAVGGFAMIGGIDCVRERLLRAAVYGEV